MISSIFGKTKPINFVFVFIYLFIFFLISFFFYSGDNKTTWIFLEKMIPLALLVFSVFLLDFISKKNNLSLNNSYLILLFVLFICVFPQVFFEINIALSNLFIFLATRKCLSLKSKIDVKRKIFDASFWVGIATLFSNWSILVLILVYLAILFYDAKNYKNWLAPIIALSAILSLVITYYILIDNIPAFKDQFNFKIKFTTSNIGNIGYLLPYVFIISVGLVSLVAFLMKIKTKTLKTQTSIFLMTILLIVGIAIAILSGDKNGAEFLFISFPMAVIVTNYIELISRKWLKESVLWIFFLLPIALLIL